MSRKHHQRVFDDSDEDEQPGPAPREDELFEPMKQKALSEQELARLTSDVMRYALFLERQRLPLTRQKINELILKEYKGRRVGTTVLENATRKFRDVFGFELTPITRERIAKKRARAAQDTGSAQDYVLLTPGPAESQEENEIMQKRRELLSWDAEGPTLALMMIILSLLELESPMHEEQLWRHLRELGVNRDDREHPAFGDVRHLVEQKFVRSLYISRRRNDQQQWEYRKGPRGKVEVPRLNLVLFIYHVMGKKELDERTKQRLLAQEAEDSSSGDEEEQQQTQQQTQQQQPAAQRRKRRAVQE